MKIQDAINAFNSAREDLQEAIKPRLDEYSETTQHDIRDLEIPPLINGPGDWIFMKDPERPYDENGVESKILLMSDEAFLSWMCEERLRIERDELEYAEKSIQRLTRDLEFARERFRELKEKK